MSTFQLTEEGRRDIEFLTRNLDEFDKSKTVKKGLRAAASVYVKKGKSNLRSRLKGTGRGSLINSFAIREKRNKPGVLAGFRRSTRYIQYQEAGNHAHLVDKGTVRRKNRKGANRGIMVGNYFWTDAAITEQQKAANAVYDGVKRAVERINNRRNA